jgi:hypothetical protein
MYEKETLTQRTINFDKFMGRVNGYLFSFMEKSITGRLIALNNGFLTVEMRSGSIIVAHESTVKSIWNIHQKQHQEMV